MTIRDSLAPVDDLISRPTTIQATSSSSSSTAYAAYTYLGWERRVQVQLPEVSLWLSHIQAFGDPVGDAGDRYVGLDRFGRVEQMRWFSGGNPTTGTSTALQQTQYGFHRAANRTWRKELAAPASALQDDAYTYDGLYQLTQLQRGLLNNNHSAVCGVPSFEEQFSFDSMGNWNNPHSVNSGAYTQSANGIIQEDQNRLHNAGNEIKQIASAVNPWASPVVSDAAGNMTAVPAPAPYAQSSRLSCVYDPWNRLVSAIVGGSSTTCVYDAVDRRIQKKDGSSSPANYYYSDQWQLLEYYTSGTSGAYRQFLWGLRYPDDLIFRYVSTDTGRRYVMHDYLNLTAVLNQAPSTTVAERFGFDAYGTPRTMTSSWGSTTDALGWEILFGASFWDSETGLHLMRYRYMHPKLGRWMGEIRYRI